MDKICCVFFENDFVFCILFNVVSVGGRVVVRGNGVGVVDEICFKCGRFIVFGDSILEMECFGVVLVREE